MEFTAIGHVSSSRAEPIDDDWDSVLASITLDSAQFTSEALDGLEQFSHLEVVYVFDRVEPEKVEVGSRHPRGNPGWPRVGIFAQRAKNRPNRIGVSVCRLLEVSGLEVRVQSLDAVDGTPVLDIKPYLSEFAPRGPVSQPGWSHQLMEGYWSDRLSVHSRDIRPSAGHAGPSRTPGAGLEETAVFGRRNDERAPLERALDAADGLKAGSWTSVEALSLLAIEAKGQGRGEQLYKKALDASAGLLDGSWDSVQALACLARAERELRRTGE